MVEILQNKKRVFWEALILTVVIFIFGMLIGIAFESQKVEEINQYYASSEVLLTDAFVLSTFVNSEQNCDILYNANLEFADKIYFEARLLEKYESSGKISDTMKIFHRKYDILRTFLWINSKKTAEKCPEKKYTSLVYIYEYEPEDLTQKATQTVWSRILSDLKQKYGKDILLIPIASDSELVSLDVLLQEFEISQYPVVIINNQNLIYDLKSVGDLERYF